MKENEPKPLDDSFTSEGIVAAAKSLDLPEKDINIAKNMEPWDALNHFIDVLVGAKNPAQFAPTSDKVQNSNESNR